MSFQDTSHISKLRVKYTPVMVNNPDAVQVFLETHFGFGFAKKITVTENIQGTIVGEKGDAEYFLILMHGTSLPAEQSSKIIINTDDCLQDYFRLSEIGVRFSNRPQYTPLGLMVELTDDNGNRFTLLEERNYSEAAS